MRGFGHLDFFYLSLYFLVHKNVKWLPIESYSREFQLRDQTCFFHVLMFARSLGIMLKTEAPEGPGKF